MSIRFCQRFRFEQFQRQLLREHIVAPRACRAACLTALKNAAASMSIANRVARSMRQTLRLGERIATDIIC